MAAQQLPPIAQESPSHPTLARTMGLFALVVYGVGDMLGAGVYALIGKVAGYMGNAVWLAYLIAMVAAALTALSYASLGSRYPRAGGSAYYAHHAFAQPFLSYLIGFAVIASGLTSIAAQSHAFARYCYGLVHVEVAPGTVPPLSFTYAFAIPFLIAMTLVNLWGIKQSTWLNIICTIVEVSGLAIIIAVGVRYWGSVNYLEGPPKHPETGAIIGGALKLPLVMSGAVLGFYAFIGFEDMSNVAEEVKDPQRTFPLGVVTAVAITSLIYMCVGITAVSVIPHATLATSGQPLVDVVRTAAPTFPTRVFSVIALFAITNTALLNYVMGSRLVFALARQGLVWRKLATIHPYTRTPHLAIFMLMVVLIGLLFAGGIQTLASATSSLLLFAFIVVNLSLIVVKFRAGEPRGSFDVPVFVPVLGTIVCAALILNAEARAAKIAFLIVVAVTLLYMITRPANITEESLIEAGEAAESS
jgi:amino acid transporter